MASSLHSERNYDHPTSESAKQQNSLERRFQTSPLLTKQVDPSQPSFHDKGSGQSTQDGPLPVQRPVSESVGREQSTTNPINEENKSGNTKTPENTVAGVDNGSTKNEQSSHHGHLQQRTVVTSDVSSHDADYLSQVRLATKSQKISGFIGEDEHQDIIRDLSASVKIEKEENTSLKEDNNQLENQREELQSERTENLDKLCKYSSEIQEKDNQLKNLKEEKRTYARRNSELENDIQKAKDKIDELEELCQKQSRLINDLTKRLDEQDRKLNEERKERQTEVQHLKQKIEDLQKKCS